MVYWIGFIPKMKKSDMSMRTIVILILVAISSISIMVWSINAGQAAKNAADSGSCLASIQNAALAKKIPHPMKGEPMFALNCPREDDIIKKGDVVVGNKIDQDKAHGIIAENMRRCWEKVGAGKLDPFSDWNDIEDKSICMVCSRMIFDRSLLNFMKDQSTKSGNNVQDVFITNPLPYLYSRTIPNKNMTYFKYLYGTDPKTGLSEEDRAKLQTSIVDHNSLILVRMYKPSERSLFWSVAGTIAAGVLIVAGVVLSPFTGGASLALTAWGIGISTAIFATGVTIAMIAVPDGISNAFGDCPDCEGSGGLMMVPSTINLYEKNVPYENDDGEIENKALCDILIN